MIRLSELLPITEMISKEYNTYCPRDVCSNSVTNVEVPGHKQLLANRAYLNSSSQTTCSDK